MNECIMENIKQMHYWLILILDIRYVMYDEIHLGINVLVNKMYRYFKHFQIINEVELSNSMNCEKHVEWKV